MTSVRERDRAYWRKVQAERFREHADCYANPCPQCTLADRLLEGIFTEEALIEMLTAWLKVFAS